MVDTTDRLEKVEARLGAVESAVTELRGEVGGLRGDHGELRDEVGSLRDEIGKLRVLEEANAGNIGLIGEAQAHHGRQLEEITKAMQPLSEIRDFIRNVAGDHERRITALERRESHA